MIQKEEIHIDWPLMIAYTNNIEEAKKFIKENDRFEPVECSFGQESVVGEFVLDHHGKYSCEEPVSSKAVRLIKEKLAFKHHFLTTGMPDPDAVYTILALSSNITSDKNIAQAIAELDVDPIGINRLEGDYIRVPAFEFRMKNPKRKEDRFSKAPYNSIEGFVHAIVEGIEVFENKPLNEDLIQKVRTYEENRLATSQSEIQEICGNYAFIISDGLSDTPHFKDAPIVVQYKPSMNVITIRGLSDESAQRLNSKSVYDIFGREGLEQNYKIMDKVLGFEEKEGNKGSGGREEIGGSPRHLKVSLDQAKDVFYALGGK